MRFGKSLKVEIQNQRWDKGQMHSRDDYTSIAYWYQEGAGQAIALPPFSQRTALTQAAGYPKRP